MNCICRLIRKLMIVNIGFYAIMSRAEDSLRNAVNWSTMQMKT